MPISENEFYEYEDDSWKNRVFEFLNENRESSTPAFELVEIAKGLTQTDTVPSDIKRKVEWALEDLVTEKKVIRTRIKIDNNFYYMAKEMPPGGAKKLTAEESRIYEEP